jgi:hypothetical protein
MQYIYFMKKALLLFCVISSLILKSQTIAGPNTSTTLANGTGSGPNWNISSPGWANVTVGGLPGSTVSNALKVTNFGFSIPANANVLGVEVVLSYSYTALGDSIVRLLINNLESGANRALGTALGTPCCSRTYGSPTDTWANSLTPADINSPNFGLAFYVKHLMSPNNWIFMTGGAGAPYQIKVYYATSTGIIESQTSSSIIYAVDKTLFVNVNSLSDIIIYNSGGQKIKELKELKENKTIDLSELSSGIYYYNLVEDQKINKGKFLIR